ncbi:hypothetical protein C8R41DRAFT_544261 [Lentinula lateritia]|uniref:Secreted protein n=1 Tax=Lentinula lateritia TaxID=40482 RepID=A0ABQ8V6D5_9AGAR|nr:hypothetical protein C8R41DRAFT_544261 [Lentinula lateritia]
MLIIVLTSPSLSSASSSFEICSALTVTSARLDASTALLQPTRTHTIIRYNYLIGTLNILHTYVRYPTPALINQSVSHSAASAARCYCAIRAIFKDEDAQDNKQIGRVETFQLLYWKGPVHCRPIDTTHQR